MYLYSLQPETIKTISSFDENKWINLFKDLLSEKAILYNIDFSSDMAYEKIIDLHSILIKYHIHVDNYDNALLILFEESVHHRLSYDYIFSLIIIIDNIKPISNFQKFALLAVSKEYSDVLDYAPANNFSNRIRLINALILMDKKGYWFSDYFMLRSNEKQEPAFYQVGIRYFQIKQLKDTLFNFYMCIEQTKLDELAIHYIYKSFKEYIWEIGKLDMLYHFIESYCMSSFKRSFNQTELLLSSHTEKLFNLISDYIIEENKLIKNMAFYIPLISWLAPTNNKFNDIYSINEFKYLLKMHLLPSTQYKKYDIINYLCSKFKPLQISDIKQNNSTAEFIFTWKYQLIEKINYTNETKDDGSIYLPDCNKVYEAIERGISSYKNAKIVKLSPIPHK